MNVNQLSEGTKELLLRYQVAILHHLMRDEFADLPGEAEWLSEYSRVKMAFKQCPEGLIAEMGRRLARGEQVEELESALYKLSLEVGDRRPAFFRNVN